MHHSLKGLFILAVYTVLFASCSSSKNLWKSRDVAELDVTVEPVNNSRSGEGSVTRADRPRDRGGRPSGATAEATERVVRPEITFNNTESAHVRILAGYDGPFTDSQKVTIDMAELATEFYYPHDGKFLSPYGMRGRSMHTGIDIKCMPNDTIRAALPGVVRMSKLYSGYGNIVVIRHYNGIETVYAHNSKNLVKVNDVVESGQPIGLAGRTGTATTEHLHFEIRVANEPIDPAIFLDVDNRRLRDGQVYLAKNGSRVVASTSQSPEILLASLSNEIPLASVEPETKAAQPAQQYHTIKSGDTLSHLARTYSTTVAKICALNGIQSTKILRLGEKIRVK